MEIIEVPIIGCSLHFGLQSDYTKLTSHWFEQKEFDDSNFLHKAFILDISYKPDEIYKNTDGTWGRCWKAIICDTYGETTQTYYFRNFIDLIKEFDKKGYIFLEV
jgi:hypothetical protein